MSSMPSKSEYSPFNRSPPSIRKKKLPRFIRSREAIHYDGEKAYRFNGEKWVRTPEYYVKR
jgi:hypothetical protein